MANRVKKNLFGVLLGPVSVTAMVLVAAIVYVLMSIVSSDPASAGCGLIPLSRTVVGSGFVEEEATAKMSQRQPRQQQEWQTVRMRVTAYCACSKCCGKYSDGITANNHRIRRGDTFAAADKKYRFGTELIIPGYNGAEPVKVIDRGKAITGNRLDVFYHTHRRAKKWGVQYLDVKVKHI
jgi:3D (Asp-Asp-Asp) domain-containing protein